MRADLECSNLAFQFLFYNFFFKDMLCLKKKKRKNYIEFFRRKNAVKLFKSPSFFRRQFSIARCQVNFEIVNTDCMKSLAQLICT